MTERPTSKRIESNSTNERLGDGCTFSLALGAGGARGLAHLGVADAIIQSGHTISHLSGTSIGALAGALLAVDSDITNVQRKVLEFIESPRFQRRQRQMFGVTPTKNYTHPSSWIRRFKKVIATPKNITRALRKLAVLPDSVLHNAIDALIPDIDIEQTQIPLSIVCVDILTGNRIVLEKGSLRKAVRASASIPSVFPPVDWDGLLLCDIGVYEAIPVDTAIEKRGDRMIAVDVSEDVGPMDQFRNIFEIFHRMQRLAEHQIRGQIVDRADIIVQPRTDGRAWFDFRDPKSLIASGYESAIEILRDKAVITAPITMIPPVSSPLVS